MTVAQLFVKCLEAEGVKYVFGVPGEENLDLLEALRTSSIKFIVTRHEQAAAFMAAAYGRLTGQAGVCLSTLGPGATNLVTGIAQAQLGGMPLVAITGQKGARENRQAKFQMVDVVNLFRPIVKWNKTIISPMSVPSLVRQAFKTAEEERPGATHLELPEDIASEEAPAAAEPLPRSAVRRPAPDPKAITQAVELIKSAKLPLILVSGGANRKRVRKQLTNFVNQTGLYVVHTQMGKGVLHDDNPHSLFAMGIHKRDYVHCALDQADLVITIGYNLTEFPPSIWNSGSQKKIIHLDFTPAEVEINYNPTLEVVADISHTLWALSEALPSSQPPYQSPWHGTGQASPSRGEGGERSPSPLRGEGKGEDDGHPFAKLRQELRRKMDEYKDDQSYPLKPQKIVYEARQALGPEDIVSLDNGIYKIWFARLYPTYAENTVLLDNALASMGAGLPAAIAAKLLYPQKKVLAVVGDGGFMMNSAELETALRLKLPIVILLLRDNAYGFIKWKQQTEGFGDFGMDFGNPDFVKYAESYGAIGWRVQRAEDLAVLLKNAFNQERLVLIDCPIDYSDNLAVLTEELDKLSCPL